MAVAVAGARELERARRRRRPAIAVVDGEPTVRAAVARDLRRALGERYRIVRVGSGDEALGLLRDLVGRGERRQATDVARLAIGATTHRARPSRTPVAGYAQRYGLP